MKCLEHKLLNRDKVEHTNSNKLSWMKNTLTRLMETSNASNAKNFRTERGLRQHCRITNCQTNLNTKPAESKPPNKP